jgi:hypothetical protein
MKLYCSAEWNPESFMVKISFKLLSWQRRKYFRTQCSSSAPNSIIAINNDAFQLGNSATSKLSEVGANQDIKGAMWANE